jgi:hypothetical protein
MIIKGRRLTCIICPLDPANILLGDGLVLDNGPRVAFA